MNDTAADAAAAVDVMAAGDNKMADAMSQTTMYQILTGVFAGLSLILMVVTIWVLVARRSGHSAPITKIQGGFSLGSLGSMMSTS
jgi:hypothetical protein